MPLSNGDGNTGGNTSVFWEVNGNSTSAPPVVADTRRATGASSTLGSMAREAAFVGVADAVGHPGRGAVAIKPHGIAGHTDTNFADIGRSNPPQETDRPGHFRVRLRFRDADMSKMDGEQLKWLMQYAKRMPELNPSSPSWFVEIDIPAIHRAQPPDAGEWAEQPWEIHWEW